MNIIYKGTPNKDLNRKPIDRIVIHWFGKGTLESANTRFQNPDNQVSAHFGISNETIYQWGNLYEVCYHAGNYEMNQRSIGLEHDATTDKNASDATYKTSAKLIAALHLLYDIPIDKDHIVPHRQIVATQCPGTLDIDRLIRESAIETRIKFNDQTIIPKELLAEDQNLEIQQIRGLLLDGKRDNLDLENARNEIKELEENNSRLSGELIVVKKGIEDLTKKLALVTPVEALKTADYTWNGLLDYLAHLFVKRL